MWFSDRRIRHIMVGMSHDPAHYEELQAQIDAITGRIAVNRADIDALQAHADESDARVDDIRDMITELQDAGLLSREHASQMEQALKTSRTIGAAIGIIMASRDVGQNEAFDILVRASQNSNRKLRDLAHELVASRGHADILP